MWWVEEREKSGLYSVLRHAAKAPGLRAHGGAVCSPWSQCSAGMVLEWYHGKERTQQPKAISKEQNRFFTFLQVNSSTPFSPVLVCQDSKLPGCKIPKNVPCVPTQPLWCCPSYLFPRSALWEVDWLSQLGGRSLRPAPLSSLFSSPCPGFCTPRFRKPPGRSPALHRAASVMGGSHRWQADSCNPPAWSTCLSEVSRSEWTCLGKNEIGHRSCSAQTSNHPALPLPFFPAHDSFSFFPLEAALLSLHSQQPHLLVSSFEPGPGDSWSPTYPPSHWPPPNSDCSSLSPGIRRIMKVPLVFFVCHKCWGL